MTTASPYRLLLDADVLIKLAVLDCFVECIAALGYKIAECATMRSMTRSAGIDSQVVREQRAGGPGKPARRLFRVLSSIPTIDKMTEQEKLLAATIGAASQKRCRGHFAARLQDRAINAVVASSSSRLYARSLASAHCGRPTTLPRVVQRAEFDEIAFVEQTHLQLSLLDQRADRCALERRDPADAVPTGGPPSGSRSGR